MTPFETSPPHADRAGTTARVEPGAERRLGVISGDRPCTGCGFNLHGQPIVRERHYQMLICRCPECGGVAGLQEYPLLGHWAGRWASLLAGVWFIAILLAVFVSADILTQVSSVVRMKCEEPYAAFIAKKHKVYQEDLLHKTTAPSGTLTWLASQPGEANDRIETAWWKLQDEEALLAEATAAGRAVSYRGLTELRWVVVAGSIMGIVWAAALPGVRRGRMWLPGLVIIGAAVAARVFTDSEESVLMAGGYYPVSSLIGMRTGALFGWIAIGFSLLPLLVGMWIGRPVVRWLVSLLLPPRLWAGLSALWTCDRLPLPRVV